MNDESIQSPRTAPLQPPEGRSAEIAYRFPESVVTPADKNVRAPKNAKGDPATAVVDLLILSDGTILAHNLTLAMAAVLNAINPEDENMKQRADVVTPVRRAHSL